MNDLSGFVGYENDLEPLATEEAAANYEARPFHHGPLPPPLGNIPSKWYGLSLLAILSGT